ncbi:MAG TPA: FAD-dependent oxidoreductase, partial [Verrucomicrobiae bacterium]|nr:FAD-dependent oxidoreductase [Verrucomicrobiae bacterium]
MIKAEPTIRRTLKLERLDCDLAIVGGGMAGLCCAITAARAGLKIALIQDRPVLGGNASSEVRLWILGATSHMGNNNRWAREGGVIDEILVENIYRNPEGNPLVLDSILLEKTVSEPNITLLLNTAVYEAEKHDADTIKSLRAFCSQNSTAYEINAPLFCDASGDGIVGFLSGAAFRIGSESYSQFGEKFAPAKPNGELLGHTVYFYSKDAGRPVKFVPPSFALQDITRIPRFRDFNVHDFGCRLWWIEWGGAFDTVHETEKIKWELWKIAYGVWDYIKNSGNFPKAETLTLEWVGTIPGKRESRRFEGDYMLTQMDIVEQRHHADAVSFGGWAIDLHPADGVFSEKPGCAQWHSKGVYQIPYRCLYSRNIKNLFLAGRIISASHIAFGSCRVMATCAHNAQAVAMAAVLCRRKNLRPAEIADEKIIGELQRELLRTGQYIPGMALHDPEDLAQMAQIKASSELKLKSLEPDGTTLVLNSSWAMAVPVPRGRLPRVTLTVDAAVATKLQAELRYSSKLENHTPDVTLKRMEWLLPAGRNQRVELNFDTTIDEPRFVFICLKRNDQVGVHLSNQRLTGIMSLSHNGNKSVTASPTQIPPPDIGIDTFEFWTPMRRPGGKNFAITVEPPLAIFSVHNLTNGITRPTRQPNAWVAEFSDANPSVTLKWQKPTCIGRIELTFDTDYDHPMESVLMGHPERVMPFCCPQFQISDGNGRTLFTCEENHQSHRSIHIQPPVEANCII